MGVYTEVLPIMVMVIFSLVIMLISGSQSFPINSKKGLCLECGPVADRLMEEQAEVASPAADTAAAPVAVEETVDLMESDDEAVGERIMEDMNREKEKLGVELKRIGEMIERTQDEQNEH